MSGAFDLAPAVLGALFVIAALAPWFVARVGRGALAILAIAPGLAAIWLMTMIPTLAAGNDLRLRRTWIPQIGLTLDLRLDVLSAVMCLIVTVLGAAVLMYSVRYFPPADDGLPKYAGSLLAFSAAMLALVLADNLMLLVVCWELTGILSYLLIAHRVRRLDSRQAASRALMVTTAGGLSLLVGAVLLGVQADTFRISAILADPPSGAGVVTAVILILVGGISKSAIVPFSFWLPGAMAAPTPASAYLHAATMVKAGIYLFARLSPAFAAMTGWRTTLLVLGGITMVSAGIVALRQRDLKLLLAYGTVSQLGLMTIVAAIGTPAAVACVAALLIGHATFKGALFFVVGIIDTSTGTRDITRLSGIGRRMPSVAVLAVMASVSMAGLPPMIGFVAKEAGYAAVLGAGRTGHLAAAVIAAGSILTVAYSVRFCWGALGSKTGVAPTAVSPRTWWMMVPTGFLVLVGLVLGIAPGSLGRFVGISDPVAVGAPPVPDGLLALWHGMGVPFWLSVVSLVGGVALFAAQRGVERRGRRLAGPGRAAGTAYQVVTAAVDRIAVWVTAVTQRGSLPVSLGSVLLVLAVFPGVTLLISGAGIGDVVLTAGPWQALLVLAVMVIGLAALRVRQALAAVLMVGGVGYAIAILYVLRGAPDLALTQVLVETVTLVVAVLVIVRMPPTAMQSTSTGRLARGIRIGLATCVGALMTALALIIPGQRRAPAVLADRAGDIAEAGGGHNIVNVILVDVRGWDTFGEISVLVAAAVGVSGLIFARNPHIRIRRGSSPAGDVPARPGGSPWLAAHADPGHSLLLEVATRLVFHLIIIFSLYVLFVGHNGPGGGFAAGLIASIALTLRYLAGGAHELAEAAPVDAGVVMGLGLVVAAVSALAGLATGVPALSSWVWHVDVPGLGTVELVSSTVFDIGVYLVVVGALLEVLRSVGAELDRQAVGSQRVEVGA